MSGQNLKQIKANYIEDSCLLTQSPARSKGGFFKIWLFFNGYLPACLYTIWMQCLQKPNEGTRHPGARVNNVSRLSFRCWEQNLGFLQKQQVLLFPKPPLQAHNIAFFTQARTAYQTLVLPTEDWTFRHQLQSRQFLTSVLTGQPHLDNHSIETPFSCDSKLRYTVWKLSRIFENHQPSSTF